MRGVIDPEQVFALRELYWPSVRFYAKQREMIVAALTSRELYVVAANKVGKDFGFGFLVMACTAICEALDIPFRIVTTSVEDSHLDILWGEIGKFYAMARHLHGRLAINSKEIRKASEVALTGTNAGSYLKGFTARDPEKFAGHHPGANDRGELGFSMCVGDESSGIRDEVKKMTDGWAQHQAWFGNPNDCHNFWRRGIEAGDLLIEDMGAEPDIIIEGAA